MIKIKSSLLAIKPYKPGKFKIDHNKKRIIKLSSNENALGVSPKAIEAYKNSSNNISCYPDSNHIELRKVIAKKHKLNFNQIICGAGSDELISFLCQAFLDEKDEIIMSEYGFLMYSICAKKSGANVIFAKEVDFKLNIDSVLDKISSKTKIIFIANPNNPTGSYLNKNEIVELVNNVPKNILIVLDLAYAEFVKINDYPKSFNLVDKNNNLVILRTFSKAYGLASLRVGWSYAPQYIIDALNNVRGPFNLTSSALTTAIAAVNDDYFLENSIQHNHKWLKIVQDKLRLLNIITYNSVANFLLIDFLEINMCQKVNNFLLDHGIILRDMSEYNLPTCLRMTIGKEEENIEVINILSKYKSNN